MRWLSPLSLRITNQLNKFITNRLTDQIDANDSPPCERRRMVLTQLAIIYSNELAS